MTASYHVVLQLKIKNDSNTVRKKSAHRLTDAEKARRSWLRSPHWVDIPLDKNFEYALPSGAEDWLTRVPGLMDGDEVRVLLLPTGTGHPVIREYKITTAITASPVADEDKTPNRFDDPLHGEEEEDLDDDEP